MKISKSKQQKIIDEIKNNPVCPWDKVALINRSKPKVMEYHCPMCCATWLQDLTLGIFVTTSVRRFYGSHNINNPQKTLRDVM